MEEIKDRLAHILRAKNLTASQFAELMKIQASNVSHLLNGRNKPSLDFLMKLKEVFPEYSFDWIILGKKPITINEPNPVVSEDQQMKFDEVEEEKIIEFDEVEEKNANVTQILENQGIERIIVVYKDKTFEILKPRQ
ncbi:helix-turn-helix domain-containing protein [uncultured Methanobrevibacter sp.]|uniref:helix-turn-helix domain-containing protein n=1 Tax=uncultured Methanobrevibacter sp. TaxID=253161 RepID=UPI00262EE9D2|nr:helix-turn-helix transcriptional regulator [uncultured Methanobrevibacter sp.]